jgi:hypothetical protein
MSDTYTLNSSQSVPRVPNKSNEVKHSHALLGAIVVIAAIVGGIIWWGASSQVSAPSPTDQQAAIRAEVAAILRSANVEPTQAEIQNVAKILTTSKETISDTDRQAVINQLK